jgi:hypothetical protein
MWASARVAVRPPPQRGATGSGVLKGRAMVAQGIALGSRRTNTSALKGRDRSPYADNR